MAIEIIIAMPIIAIGSNFFFKRDDPLFNCIEHPVPECCCQLIKPLIHNSILRVIGSNLSGFISPESVAQGNIQKI